MEHIDKADIQPPYFVASDSLPGLDFNRDIIKPGEHKEFPDGAIGIRVDGDYWPVAALPYKYIDVPLREIVEEFWPQYIEQAIFEPDSGSVEQKIHFANLYAKSQENMIKYYSKQVRELEDKLNRLRAGRHDLHELHSFRHRAFNDYFIRQYEHLLIAVAHPASPRPHMQGVCETCGLYVSDRVHLRRYQELHDAGYEPGMKHLTEFKD